MTDVKDHRKEIIKRLEQNADRGRRRAWQVFDDWLCIVERELLDLPAHIEHNQAYGSLAPQNEETLAVWSRLYQWYPQEDKEAWRNFSEASVLLIDAAHTALKVGGDWDILGGVFMEYGVPDKWAGQFFTSWDVAALLARLTPVTPEMLQDRLRNAMRRTINAGGRDAAMLGDDPAMMLERFTTGHDSDVRQWFHWRFLPAISSHFEPITVYDAAVGSAVMLMAHASMLPSWLNFWGMARYYGQDIDPLCVQMARINMMLHNLNGQGVRIRLAHWRGEQRIRGIDPDDMLAEWGKVGEPSPKQMGHPIGDEIGVTGENGRNRPVHVDVDVKQLALFA